MNVKRQKARRKAIDDAQKMRDLPPQDMDYGVPVGVSAKKPIANQDHKKKMALKKAKHKKSKTADTPVKVKRSKKARGEGKRTHTQPKNRIQ